MERIGKYVIHKAAVTTGYARVLFCLDPDLKVPVAVKLFRGGADRGVLSPAQLLERFLAEARALAGLDHPHIVAVKTLEWLEDGRPYFVMPYQAAHLPYEIGKDVPGRDVPERDRPRKVPVARAVQLLRQTALALSALHRRGMVHRAVKPSNLLLTAREGGSIRLCDFSMVKLPERNLPLPDHWLGATDYCAPEQRDNATSVGPRADVYSLGVLAHRLVTGTLPHPAGGTGKPGAGVPKVMAELIARCTAPDPESRPAHAGEVLDLLDRIAAERLAKPEAAKPEVIRRRKVKLIPGKLRGKGKAAEPVPA